MLIFMSSLLAVLSYLLASILLVKRLTCPDKAINKRVPILIGLAGAVLHATVISRHAVVDNHLNFGFTISISFAMLFITALLLFSSLRKPIENLGILILPITALALIIHVTLPTTHLLNTNESYELGLHILFSMLAYSLLSLAAVQAIVLSFQERNLHNRQPGGIIRALPPLETMDILLFQMITIGFTLQTMSLASGIIHLEDMFAQHLAHKTILSVFAWLVFATLLWGRWRYGWRSRTAVRWTLSGFIALLLAYFGSKYVLEIILER